MVRTVIRVQHPADTDIHARPFRGDEDFNIGRYRPNLKPVGWLIVKFEPGPDDILPPAVSFVVGEKDGKYMITVAEEVK